MSVPSRDAAAAGRSLHFWRVRRVLRRHGLLGVLQLAWRKTGGRLIARKAIRRFQEHEREFDRRHCIDTAGYIRADQLGVRTSVVAFAGAYQGIDPALFEKLMDALPISPDRCTFVDFGSGKGRAVLLASRWPFRKIIGVELARPLHEVACANLRRFPADGRQCHDIELVCQDAGQYPIPDGDAVLFFYYPFEKAIMDRVVANIEASLAGRRRSVYLLLVNVPYAVAPAGFVEVPVSVDSPIGVRVLHSGPAVG